MNNWLKKQLAYLKLRNRMRDGKPVKLPDPPEWFADLYDDYIRSEEGTRLYGKDDR